MEANSCNILGYSIIVYDKVWVVGIQVIHTDVLISWKVIII
jgi:hypothetical protein